MRYWLLNFFVYWSFVPLVLGQGTLLQQNFFSATLSEEREIFIYLPEGYVATDTSVSYPVICFLHGGGVGPLPYAILAPNILNDLISSGRIRPAIFVLPDGDTGPYEGSFYTNSELYGRFEDYIVNDVLQYVESRFNTAKIAGGRYLAGHSMGAYGAMKIALKHPELFRGVAALSGPLDLRQLTALVPDLLAETAARPPYSYTPDAGPFSSFAFTMAGAFSPNVNNPPYFVDFPLDAQGEIVGAVFDRWLAHNPPRFARTNFDPDFDIYFDCGTEDEFRLFPFNTAFADSLTALGIPFRFRPFAGGHVDKLASRVQLALVHVDSVLGSSVPTFVQVPSRQPAFVLYANYPNPFNPETTISFSLHRTLHVELKIYNARGQEVATLVSQTLSAGDYRLRWQAAHLPSGVYYAYLKGDQVVQTRKLLLVR